METIKGKCMTNLDDYNVSLVTEFARCPNIGERVAVLHKGNKTSLKICQITHSVQKGFKQTEFGTSNTETPFIIVELHH